MPRVAATIALWVLGVAIGAGCGSGELPLDQADSALVAVSPPFDHVMSIVARECTPCHDDAGVEPRYETCEDVFASLSAFERTALFENSMPPGAWERLTSEEKLTIRRWLDAGAAAPCGSSPGGKAN